jgi:hypothetical protein
MKHDTSFVKNLKFGFVPTLVEIQMTFFSGEKRKCWKMENGIEQTQIFVYIINYIVIIARVLLFVI